MLADTLAVTRLQEVAPLLKIIWFKKKQKKKKKTLKCTEGNKNIVEQSLCHHGVESQQPSLPVSNYTQPIRTKRKPAQTHSSNNRKKEKKEKWNHLNVKWPMLAHATTLTSSSSFFSQSLFLFSFSPQIQEACGVEADVVAWDAGCGGGDFGVNSFWAVWL